MDCPGINFEELKFEQVQGVAKGAFAQVALIVGTELVVKVASSGAYDHHVREKRVYERLGRHPYILRYHGEAKVVSTERALVGLLLQYHPAGTLAAVLSHQRVPNYVEKTRWLIQATEAVRYIHSKGVIHGDLGSHNFLVQNDGTLSLADFGGSRIDGSECLEHPPARYTRPAIASRVGSQPTERDDLFALGTVLYEISTCQLLYQGKTDSEIRDLFVQQIFPDLASVAASVHLVIEKCWKDGYDSAEEVSRDIRELLGFTNSTSRFITREERGLQWLTPNFQFPVPSIHQLTRRTLLRYIGLFSMTLVVILAAGAKRGIILRFGRLVSQVLFGKREKL